MKSNSTRHRSKQTKVDWLSAAIEDETPRFVLAPNVRVGDVILENSKRIEVRSAVMGESCRNMHINDNACYDRSSVLRVLR